MQLIRWWRGLPWWRRHDIRFAGQIALIVAVTAIGTLIALGGCS